MEQKQHVNIMETPEMAAYMSIRQEVQEDTALTELLSAYKASAARLVSMIQSGSFDPVEVVTLSDDTDRMKNELEQNEKLIKLENARQAVEVLLQSGEAAYMAFCSGNCAACHGCASNVETKKED